MIFNMETRQDTPRNAMNAAAVSEFGAASKPPETYTADISNAFSTLIYLSYKAHRKCLQHSSKSINNILKMPHKANARH